MDAMIFMAILRIPQAPDDLVSSHAATGVDTVVQRRAVAEAAATHRKRRYAGAQRNIPGFA